MADDVLARADGRLELLPGDSLCKMGLRQRLLAVFSFQQLRVLIWNLDWKIFEVAVAQRENIVLLQGSQYSDRCNLREIQNTYVILMPVLADQSTQPAARSRLVVCAHGGDVDEHARRRIDPPRIDHVQRVLG